MVPELLLTSLIALLLGLLLDRHLKIRERARIGLCGPPAMLLLGNLHQMGSIMAKNGNLLYNVFEEWKRQYGKIYAFFMGPRLFIIVENLETVRQVLIKRFDCFTDRMELDFLSGALSASLVAAKGAEWKEMRSCLSPTFTTAKMRTMSLIVHEKLDIFMENVGSLADDKVCFNIYENFKALTLDVIAQCAFAMQSNCQTNLKDPFLFHSQNYFHEMPSPERSILMRISVILPELAPYCCDLYTKTSTSGQSETWLFEKLTEVIDARATKEHKDVQIDVVKLLLDRSDTELNNATNKRMLNPQQVANNCFAFLLAGYETTSTTLAFSAWLLAKHQAEQEQLFEELEQNLRNVAALSVCDLEIVASNGSMDLGKVMKLNRILCYVDIEMIKEREDFYDVVMKLPYLDAVFHEVLRLFPPITFFVNRTCTKACTIDGIDFVPGVQVGVPIWNIHRDEAIWPDPDAFQPERFYMRKDYHPMAWLPFGGGPRSCVGSRFAAMEYKATIARLVLSYKIKFGSTSEDPLPLKNSTAMLSTDRVNVCLERRPRPECG